MTLENPAQLAQGDACAVGPDGTSPLHPLAQLAVIVTAEVGTVADRNGLTPMQARMLGLLVHGPRRMAELAQNLGVEKAALTGLVDRAESRGLVARESVPGDRRSTQVIITDAGAAASVAFYAQLNVTLDRMIATLPAADRPTFTTWTSAIVAAQFSRRRDITQDC
ncbi:MarR family winged helix-turn-helix transcriptional regulator [Sanguibacter sp. HDW7]|uniref:MarR family winged helix-turn-helix transcriptional regulator n=1 Tax=Sanguibacter sp. HDW7 TaxID=2714931 RepID=UPI001407FA8B|nr:MarR family transcriptional regulator [Sanguibacter sp. HDW7]QIK84407.1 MarR family transcriptional regulator [Sanguibacter sp. HDW7]